MIDPAAKPNHVLPYPHIGLYCQSIAPVPERKKETGGEGPLSQFEIIKWDDADLSEDPTQPDTTRYDEAEEKYRFPEIIGDAPFHLDMKTVPKKKIYGKLDEGESAVPYKGRIFDLFV